MVIAALIGHILAGGDGLSPHSAVGIIAVAISLALFISTKSSDPFRVTIAIFLAQNLSHFILGGSSSNTQMLSSHLIAGALSYIIISYFEKELPSLNTVIVRIFKRIFSFTPISLREITFTDFFYEFRIKVEALLNTLLLRAPPHL